MEPFDDASLDLARSALAIPGIVSAAIFVQHGDSADLRLVAAAGIEGEPLRRLAAAVLDPAHPIAMTLRDAAPSFDALPAAPGGPALRSHLPLLAQREGRQRCVGVLAVAHDRPLDEQQRAALGELARRAARLPAANAVSG